MATLLCNRILDLSANELQLYNEDEAAWAYFQQRERELISQDTPEAWMHFLRGYASHIPVTGGQREPLSMWYEQESLLAPAIYSEDKLVVLKARRLGFTLLVAHFFVWFVCFCPRGENSHVAAISNTGDNAKEFLATCRAILDYLSEAAPWLETPYGENSINPITGKRGLDQSKEFEIAHRRAKISSFPPNDAIASRTITVLFLDELGRYYGSADPNITLAAATPTTEGGGKVLVGSTAHPEGKGGKGRPFYLLWEGAENYG